MRRSGRALTTAACDMSGEQGTMQMIRGRSVLVDLLARSELRCRLCVVEGVVALIK